MPSTEFAPTTYESPQNYLRIRSDQVLYIRNVFVRLLGTTLFKVFSTIALTLVDSGKQGHGDNILQLQHFIRPISSTVIYSVV